MSMLCYYLIVCNQYELWYCDIYYQILPKSKLFKFYTFTVNNLIRFHFFTSEFNEKTKFEIYTRSM